METVENAVHVNTKDGQRVALLDLGFFDCHFPLGDPRDDDFGFCGAPVAFVGSPYCCECRGIAYISGQIKPKSAAYVPQRRRSP